jgi:hypothetical protein
VIEDEGNRVTLDVTGRAVWGGGGWIRNKILLFENGTLRNAIDGKYYTMLDSHTLLANLSRSHWHLTDRNPFFDFGEELEVVDRDGTRKATARISSEDNGKFLKIHDTVVWSGNGFRTSSLAMVSVFTPTSAGSLVAGGGQSTLPSELVLNVQVGDVR